MSKRKYRYIHMFNGHEVDKLAFMVKLGQHCTEVIGNSPNPLLNVEVVDEVALRKLYAKLQRSGILHIFWGDGYSHSFQIKKEKIL